MYGPRSNRFYFRLSSQTVPSFPLHLRSIAGVGGKEPLFRSLLFVFLVLILIFLFRINNFLSFELSPWKVVWVVAWDIVVDH